MGVARGMSQPTTNDGNSAIRLAKYLVCAGGKAFQTNVDDETIKAIRWTPTLAHSAADFSLDKYMCMVKVYTGAGWALRRTDYRSTSDRVLEWGGMTLDCGSPTQP